MVTEIKLKQGARMFCFRMFGFDFHYVYVHMYADAHSGQKRESDPLIRGAWS